MRHSYSNLSAYKKCPALYKASYIERRIPKVDSPALKRGREIHKTLEQAVLSGKVPEFVWTPPGLILTLAGAGAKPEAAYGLTRAGEPCDTRDENAWLIGYIDVELDGATDSLLVDWKTGSDKWLDPFQADVYAVFKRAQRGAGLPVEFWFVYVDGRKTKQERPDQWAKDRVLDAIKRCETEVRFEPTPNVGCKYCPLVECKFHPGGRR